VGFLTQWKRTPEVAAAVAEALPPSGGMLVHVQAPWPYDPVGARAAGEDAALKAVAAKYPRLEVSTEFLAEERLLDLIYASDLGFVFHGIDTCSVSAATKAFVSGRCPVVVTGSTHASDMIRGVKRVSGFDPKVFGQEVVKTASDPALRERLREGAAKEYERLNMDAVARRYVEEFAKL
jgi:glycosyltransferase involved in cell wall biosynthesis